MSVVLRSLLLLCLLATLLVASVASTVVLGQKPEGNASNRAAHDFERDVLPILELHCVECHRPGEVAPMSLRSWQEVRPWARSIHRAVVTGEMPPWFADPEVGSFRNERRLTEREIATLVAWVEAGAPGSASASAPSPESEAAAGDRATWQIGEPDLVIQMPRAYPVPAEGVVDYVNIKIPTGLKEARWVDAIEVRPGERSVIHHIDVLVCRPGCPEDEDLAALEPGVPSFFPTSDVTEPPEPRLRAGISGDDVEFLASFLPGGRPQDLPAGQARLLPAGAEIVLNLHYTPDGAARSDLSSVGFRFAKKPPEQRVVSFFLDNYSLWIPAGSADYQLDTEAVLAQEATLLSLTPHMHSRGSAAEVEYLAADGGEPTPLLRVPRYDFNWQIDYEFERPLRLSVGDRLRYRLSFDNSPRNPSNPDPARNVPWGRQTSDEMSSLFVTVAVPPEVAPSEVWDYE